MCSFNGMRKYLLIGCLCCCELVALHGQTIFTDRPTVATSPNTLPVNWLQLETGFQYQIRDVALIGNLAPGLKFESILYNGLLMRYGLGENIELRFNQSVQQNRFRLNGETTADDGVDFAPTSLGVKWRLVKDKKNWPDIAILANYGNSILTDNGGGSVVDFSLLFNSTVFRDVSFDYNLGIILENEFNIRTFTYAFVLAKMLNEKVGGFFELYGSQTEELNALVNVDMGLIYLVSNTFQLDVYAGTGFSDLSPNIMFGLGISKLFLPKE